MIRKGQCVHLINFCWVVGHHLIIVMVIVVIAIDLCLKASNIYLGHKKSFIDYFRFIQTFQLLESHLSLASSEMIYRIFKPF